jgi:hypothetical protein
MADSPLSHHDRYPLWSRVGGGIFSFILPGAGQILQGFVHADWLRLSKGIFFLVSLSSMFFYGMYLGRWKNVYIPHWQEWCLRAEEDLRARNAVRMRQHLPPLPPPQTVRYFGYTFYPLPANLLTRLQYLGQFWIGLPAWPALWNYYFPDKPILTDYYPESPGGRLPEIPDMPHASEIDRMKYGLDEFEQVSNAIHRDMGTMWDIAWVYTVLAGVLNILVIFDAVYGPYHPRRRPQESPPAERTAEGGGS